MKKKFMLNMCGLFMMMTMMMSGCRIDANAAVISGTCGDNITWEYNDETKALVLKGSGAMADSEYEKAPWREYNEEIKSVAVEEGITTIGNNAFAECRALESVTLPNGITSIGANAFLSTGVTSVDLPESLESIGASAFDNCEALVDMELPEGIQFLGTRAFAACTNWENADIPSGVKELGNGVYSGCMKMEKAELPDCITKVPDYMFESCSSLKTVVMSDSVTEIGGNAFDGCHSLQNIDIPDTVTSIGWYAFFDCKRLTEVSVPKGVTKLKSNVFAGCVALKTVNLPDEMTRIGISVFGNCRALTNITLPKGLVELPASVFQGCVRLTSIHLPESLELISNGNFEGAENLFRMTIDSRAVLKAIADPEIDEGILEYPKTVYIKADINDELDLTQYGYTNVGEVDKEGKHYIIYADHVHTESGCAVCMTTGIEFNDVTVEEYYYSPVIWAADEGVTSGLTPTTFGPNNSCTRAQVVTFLWRAEGEPEASETEPFADVPSGEYYYDAVQWAAEKGITNGYGNGKFGSNDTVTRAQFVTFLWRLKGEQKVSGTNPFSDLVEEEYYYDAVLWAVEKGITTGLYPDKFAPNATCTRGQVVTFIFRTGSWDVDQVEIVFPW